MKAIVAHEYGGPDVLKYEDVAILQAKENEALRREKGRAGGHANSSADRREEALEQAATHHRRGKIVLAIGDEARR